MKKTTLVAKSGKKKRLRLKTHDRIVAFRSANPKAAGLLEAIKWLGNAGSHADLRLDCRAMTCSMAHRWLLEHVLHLLLDKTDAAVAQAGERKST